MKVRILLLLLAQLTLLPVLALLEPMQFQGSVYGDPSAAWMQPLSILAGVGALACLGFWVWRRSNWLLLLAGLSFAVLPCSLAFRHYYDDAKERAKVLEARRKADWDRFYRAEVVEALEDYVAADPGRVSRPNPNLDFLELPGFAEELARKHPGITVKNGKIYDPWGCRLLPVQESGKPGVIRIPGDVAFKPYADWTRKVPLLGVYVDHFDNLEGCQHSEVTGEHLVALRPGRSGVFQNLPRAWEKAPPGWDEKNVLRGRIYDPQIQHFLKDGQREERKIPRHLVVPKYPPLVLEDNFLSQEAVSRIYRAEPFPLVLVDGSVYTLATSFGVPFLRKELQIEATPNLPYAGMVFRVDGARPTALGVVLPDYVQEPKGGPKRAQDLSMKVRLGVEGRVLPGSVLKKAVWEDLSTNRYVVMTLGALRMPSRARVLWFRISDDGTFKPEAG